MRSFINTEAINKSKGTTPDSFSAFMSGRRGTMGSSVLESAKNKIVSFERASVKPVSSSVPDVINKISTNVTNTSTNISNANSFSTLGQKLTQNINNTLSTFINNVRNQNQNVVKTIQTQFRNSVDALTDNIKRDYQQKVQTIENSRPFSILRKFLDLYKNAIGFISYFSDEKNFRKIRTALKTLRRIFDESFSIATIIRQAIVRIVRQLSNLPTASGNAPDLNLDLRVPGGPLRQQGQRSIGNFGRSGLGRAIGFGAAAGVGMGAAQMVGSGISKAEQFQEEKLRASSVSGEKSQQTVPEDFLNSMERIINTFSKSIEDLIKFVTERSKQRPTSSPSPGASPQSPPPESNVNTGVTIQDEAQGLSELGVTQQQYNAYKQGVADIEGARYNQMGGAGNRFAGRYQMGSAEIASAAAVVGIPTPSLNEYLSNPELQERIYMGRTILMHRTMQRISPEYKNIQSTTERLSILAGAQLGEGNLRKYLKGGSVTDSNNVKIERWIEAARSRISKVNTNVTPPPSVISNGPSSTGIQTGPPTTIPQPPSPSRPSQVNPQGPRSSRVTGQPSSTTVASASQQSGVPESAVNPGQVVVIPLNIGTPPSPPQPTQVASSSQPIGNEGASNAIGGASLSSSDPTSPGWPWARAHLNITLV